ncbi:uncharacterized protein LOC120120566, partial [Hibiscus syriacus]|uniref:uncharacterized protein LOC120120566 n=1 Tax=Hibiscus syriacus TaxID=106335 RepID=UPI001921D392
MASSQLEIVASSTFGCVVNYHNCKERCRDNNVKSVFHKNFNDLVRDHINGCISMPSPQGPQNHHVNNVKNDDPSASTIPSRPPPILDRWVTRKSQYVAQSNTNKRVNEVAEPLLTPSQSYSNTATSPMPPPSSCSRTFGAWETERVRIVDIIKKLKNGDEHEHSNNEYMHCFSMVRNTPLLRGRQAVHDLLVQIERDKKRELASLVQRHAVSKFQQRGRLQSMLRLRSLQRCRTIQDSCRPQLLRAQLNRLPQESSAMHLREKFRTGAERLMAQQNVLAAWRCFQKDKNSTGKPQEREDTHCLNVDRSSWPVKRLKTNKNEHAKPFSDAIQQKTSLDARCSQSPITARCSQSPKTERCSESPRIARCSESPKIAKPRTSLKGKSMNEVSLKQESNTQQHLFHGSQEIVTRNEVAKADQVKDQHHLSLESQGTMEPCDDHHLHLGLESQCQDTIENEIGEEEGDDHHQHLGLESKSHNTVENKIGVEEIDDRHQHLGLDSQSQDTIENEIGEEEGDGNRQHLELDTESHDTLEKSSTCYINDSNENEAPEEEDDHNQQYFEESNDYDWFSNISRPKSYWESLRKAWYHEVLNTAPKNEDIRELVKRGRVSTLLVSDFRESMDQLLTCRIQIQTDLAENQQDVEDMDGTISRRRVSNLLCSDFLERMKRLVTSRAQVQADGAECSQQEVEGKEESIQPMCCLQTNFHPEGDQGEEQEYDDDDDDQDEEESSSSSHQCHEANNFSHHCSSSLQMPSPDVMAMRSWSSQDDNETGKDYERGASEFSPPPQQSQAQCFQDASQSSSSTNRPSLEMELIYELRGHIEQLHREMSELRKSFLSCMDMQMKMQQYSFDRKVHSVEEEVKNSTDKLSWKRTCCVCYEMQVDSLLYRCGHMCTCLKCGNELQKCPLCQASILDVFKIFVD